MKERQFQQWVVEVAERFQWRVWHVPAPMRATKTGWVGAKEAKGLPDLVMLHSDPPTLVFAECKGTGGKLSPEQVVFLALARGVGQYRSETLNMLTPEFQSPNVGAYLFQPGMEQQIEDLLRSRVLS